MKKGKLYGVGVGPGDKELITIKAIRILKEADIIAVPKRKNGGETAYEIVEEYIKEKEILECNMAMTKEKEILNKIYEIASNDIEEKLKEGKSVAFITLGDPTVYSTYMQINRIIKERGYETELISGITSFCAVASRLNISLCERKEPLMILPASYKNTEEILAFKGTKVFMKAGKEIKNLIDEIKAKGKTENSYMVECCGMENEKIYRDINEVGEDTSYYSIIIVKEEEK